MERIRFEEFERGGKDFIYIDFSDFNSNEEFDDLFKTVEPAIAKYPEGSLYTITNIDNTWVDTETKDLFVKYMKHNMPYVKYGAMIGLDGIKKLIVNSVLVQSGRDNMIFAFTIEQAIKLLLQMDEASPP